jgi:hypothetical protein
MYIPNPVYNNVVDGKFLGMRKLCDPVVFTPTPVPDKKKAAIRPLLTSYPHIMACSATHAISFQHNHF